MKLFAIRTDHAAQIVVANTPEMAYACPPNSVNRLAFTRGGFWCSQIRRELDHNEVREIAPGGLLPNRIVWADEQRQTDDDQDQSQPDASSGNRIPAG